jgi:hypothetical protein
MKAVPLIATENFMEWVGRRTHRAKHGVRRRGHRPTLEAIEPRVLLANFTVLSTNDSGPDTLRDAITAANSNPGPDTISFDFPAANGPGVNYDSTTQLWTISITSALPTITDLVSIDGYSQNKAAQNKLATGFNAQVSVVLDGGVGGIRSNFAGLTIQSDHNRIRGLAIDGFATGIAIQGPSAIGNLIQGNYIGRYLIYLDPNLDLGKTTVGGIGNGVGVSIASPSNNTLGGVSPETHNAIAGNALQGVVIDVGANGNQVVGNLIGVLEESENLYYQVGNGAEGILVKSSSNAIGGAAVGATNVISANQTYGIHIVGPDAVRNRVQANYIGTDPNGLFVFGQGNPGNGWNDPAQLGNLRDGIFIDDAPDNTIGISGALIASHLTGPPANVISGNFGAGVRIGGASATGNIVLGNFIGTDLNGAGALPNFQEGVAISSARNTVGGLNPGDLNVISGNRRGVLISGSDATGNLVIGNLIGTNGTHQDPDPGTYDVGNALEGVRIEDASGNTVGGSSAAARNIISGNNLGVAIAKVSGRATGNLVLGNYIGTDITGTFDLGNSNEGVRIESASGNTVGGTATGAGNVISANHWGVIITGAAATGNRLLGNSIGTDASGQIRLGNEVHGVWVNDGASNNWIGGLGTGAGNTIAFNVRDGVRIESVGSVGNSILSNRIFSNGILGIDLVPPVPPQGPNVGPNRLLAAPTLSSVTSTASGVRVIGTYPGVLGEVYSLQFFANSGANPSGSFEGEIFLGTTTFTVNATGTFTADLPFVVNGGQVVTATATDSAGNTSEFSAPRPEIAGQIAFPTVENETFFASEGAGNAIITINRVGGGQGFATVTYKVSNGTGKLGFTPGPDASYTVPPDGIPEPTLPGVLPTYYTGTAVFNLGGNSATFSIPLLDNDFPNGDKTIRLELISATGAAIIVNPSQATLQVNDDDIPGTIEFSPTNDYVVNESEGSITVGVLRLPGGIPVSVDYSTGGGTATPGVRYTPVSGTLHFARNQTFATITIPILDDAGIQGNQTFNLTLSNATNLATIFPPVSQTITIEDDLRDRSGPTVQSVRFQTRPGGIITALVVAFDRPVIASTATNLLNYGYSVITAGRDHRFGSRDDLIIPIVAAAYDPEYWTVTLNLGRGIHPPTPFRFRINESTDVPGAGVGVAGLTGNLLDGDYDGIAGSPFSVVLKGRTGGFAHVTHAGRQAKRRQHFKTPRRPHARVMTPVPKVIYRAE